MWLFTVYGFFSVVQERPFSPPRGQGKVVVRARFREHIDALAAFGRRNRITLPEPVATPGRDYAYRMSLPVSRWLSLLGRMVMDDRYTNFKAAVEWRRASRPACAAQVDRQAYLGWLHDVWEQGRQIQEFLSSSDVSLLEAAAVTESHLREVDQTWNDAWCMSLVHDD